MNERDLNRFFKYIGLGKPRKVRGDKGHWRTRPPYQLEPPYYLKEPSYRRVTKEEVDRFARFLRRGRSLRYIARKCKRSVATIHFWLHRRGYELMN